MHGSRCGTSRWGECPCGWPPGLFCASRPRGFHVGAATTISRRFHLAAKRGSVPESFHDGDFFGGPAATHTEAGLAADSDAAGSGFEAHLGATPRSSCYGLDSTAPGTPAPSSAISGRGRSDAGKETTKRIRRQALRAARGDFSLAGYFSYGPRATRWRAVPWWGRPSSQVGIGSLEASGKKKKRRSALEFESRGVTHNLPPPGRPATAEELRHRQWIVERAAMHDLGRRVRRARERKNDPAIVPGRGGFEVRLGERATRDLGAGGWLPDGVQQESQGSARRGRGQGEMTARPRSRPGPAVPGPGSFPPLGPATGCR